MTEGDTRPFIVGSGLSRRWSGRSDFTVAETAFGLGHNFIATWQAWRDDPGRPSRLHYVAVEARPPTPADLRQAHDMTREASVARVSGPPLAQQLADQWPTPVRGLHRLSFEQGAVQLLLAFGDLRTLLPDLVFESDAWFLGDGDPAGRVQASDRRVIRAVARRCRLGAILVAPWIEPDLVDRLTAAGFACRRDLAADEPGSPREVLRACHEPRHTVPSLVASAPPDPRQAVVVGAGLAGACVAASLAAQGFAVEVLDRHAEAAGDSSGNPAGLFHGTVHGDDGLYARLFRAAALHTARLLRSLPQQQVPHGLTGLLRLEHELSHDAMQTLVTRQGLRPDYVQALSADQASHRAGVPLSAPAWLYPEGGWVAPAALVRQRLARPGVRFIGRARVQAIRRRGPHWQCLDGQGQVLAAAPHLVLANAEQANALLAPIGWPAYPWTRTRGQVSLFQEDPQAARLRLPVAGAGYAVPMPDGWLLCGATTSPVESASAGADGDDATPWAEDHRANFARLQALCGLRAPDDVARWHGRVGWRVQPADRLPVAGPVAVREPDPATRLDQARLVPREPGLHIACGFGARGITLAPLLGDLVAARISGSPVPLEQGLVDLVDPARWVVRAARRRSRPG